MTKKESEAIYSAEILAIDAQKSWLEPAEVFAAQMKSIIARYMRDVQIEEETKRDASPVDK